MQRSTTRRATSRRTHLERVLRQQPWTARPNPDGSVTVRVRRLLEGNARTACRSRRAGTTRCGSTGRGMRSSTGRGRCRRRSPSADRARAGRVASPSAPSGGSSSPSRSTRAGSDAGGAVRAGRPRRACRRRASTRPRRRGASGASPRLEAVEKRRDEARPQRLATAPIARPRATRPRAPGPSTSRRTLPDSAPSAMRTAISVRRRETAYAVTPYRPIDGEEQGEPAEEGGQARHHALATDGVRRAAPRRSGRRATGAGRRG